MPKVFFATDLHGSEVCWKKFLNAARFYDADVLICGGDMTGKAIVPIVSENGHFSVTLGGEHQTVAAEQVGEVEANIRRKGYYPLRMSVDRLHELDGDAGKRAACFQEVMLEGVERWMGMAAEKDRKSTRLNSQSRGHLVCRLLLEKKKTPLRTLTTFRRGDGR